VSSTGSAAASVNAAPNARPKTDTRRSPDQANIEKVNLDLTIQALKDERN
jgi:hypothetical protein